MNIPKNMELASDNIRLTFRLSDRFCTVDEFIFSDLDFQHYVVNNLQTLSGNKHWTMAETPSEATAVLYAYGQDLSELAFVSGAEGDLFRYIIMPYEDEDGWYFTLLSAPSMTHCEVDVGRKLSPDVTDAIGWIPENVVDRIESNSVLSKAKLNIFKEPPVKIAQSLCLNSIVNPQLFSKLSHATVSDIDGNIVPLSDAVVTRGIGVGDTSRSINQLYALIVPEEYVTDIYEIFPDANYVAMTSHALLELTGHGFNMAQIHYQVGNSTFNSVGSAFKVTNLEKIDWLCVGMPDGTVLTGVGESDVVKFIDESQLDHFYNTHQINNLAISDSLSLYLRINDKYGVDYWVDAGNRIVPINARHDRRRTQSRSRNRR